MSVRGVWEGCELFRLAGEKSHDSQGRDDRANRGGKTDSQGSRVGQDRQSARELSYERRIMPLRYCAMKGWRGPRAVIFIGGVGQLSTGILAERRGCGLELGIDVGGELR